MSKFSHALMENNITREDLNSVISFLQQDPTPILTNASPKIKEFEDKWNEWLGTKYTTLVSSGAMANELTMLIIKQMFGKGAEIVVPPLTWASDWYSVIRNGLVPITCDINFRNLSFDLEKLKKIITPKTKAIFLTHVLGLNALSDELIKICEDNNLLLIEDCSESHGATFKGKKVGNFSFVSNFSFFFAHHMSTIEGAAISTNDERFYQLLRCNRSHSMLRESTDEEFKKEIQLKYPDVNPDFLFLDTGFNCRSNAISATIGIEQLKRLDSNNEKRIANFKCFIENLNKNKYFTDFDMEGQSNYAFILILKEFNRAKWKEVENTLKDNSIEYRSGGAGGGSQLKQPVILNYMKENGRFIDESEFPIMENINFCSAYIGNYPSLTREKIDKLLQILNNI